MSYPDEVDILTADDIHKGAMNGPRRTHCAVGWLAKWYSSFDYANAAKLLKRLIGPRLIADWNDSDDTSKSTIAHALNATNRRLGYAVPKKYCGKFAR